MAPLSVLIPLLLPPLEPLLLTPLSPPLVRASPPPLLASTTGGVEQPPVFGMHMFMTQQQP